MCKNTDKQQFDSANCSVIYYRKNLLVYNAVNEVISSTIIYSIYTYDGTLIPQKYREYIFTQIQYNKFVSAYLL